MTHPKDDLERLREEIANNRMRPSLTKAQKAEKAERTSRRLPERTEFVETPDETEPEYRFKKVGNDWCVSVWDGPNAKEGDKVTITTKAGKESEVTLGALVSEDRRLRIFSIAKEAKEERKENPEPEAGMYKLDDGTIVRVYLGQRSGRMLAKKLVSEGDHHDYEYMGAARRFVSPETAKLTLEEAKEFGRMTGHCCVCARRLDVPESVEAGIGPVCAGRVEG